VSTHDRCSPNVFAADYSFQLTLTCTVTSVTKTGSIANIAYHEVAGTMSVNLPTYTVVPNCGGVGVTYALSLVGGGTVPAAFSIDTTNKKFQITAGTSIASGVYNVRITATETWSASSPKTESTCTFQVTVTCTDSLSILTNVIPASYTYLLNPNTLNTISWATPTFGPTPTNCVYGPVTYSVVDVATGTCPSWITCAPVAGSSVSIGTTSVDSVGTHNLRINLLDSVSGLNNNSVTFSIIIRVMDATSIAMATKPSN
jgi:hypothetical protein